MRKTPIISAITLASALLLGACGAESGSTAMPGMQSSAAAAGAGREAGHNPDDVTFVQQMIPHHTDAVNMAKLVPSRSKNPQVIDLASRIEKGQDPEIQQMQGWLSTWNASMPGMPGMSDGSMPGMSGGSMPGMMSAEDMQKLGEAKGAEFDKMWLDMMIKHHQGAIDMAKTELGKGASTEAKTLAQKIIDAQQGEITEMQGMPSKS
ncbi:DUF305 domain-containing protein [Amycolatopsis sp. NPDC021455]|uniref:DUF305 domain-containing protein n=1 Tax=Amycolatopsis sp. NPDC021455 TaxID=3154901 RepID=UPI0033CE7DFB